VGIPAHPVGHEAAAYMTYGMPENCPDNNADSLQQEVAQLRDELKQLRAQVSARANRFSQEP